MKKPVFVQFECGQEDRTSKQFGPYPYAQLTYLSLDIGDGEHIAFYDPARTWGWVCLLDGQEYSDLIISAV